MCDECFALFRLNRKARLCKECYEFAKENVDIVIRDHWAWGDDLEPFADQMKKKFLKGLEGIKPLD